MNATPLQQFFVLTLLGWLTLGGRAFAQEPRAETLQKLLRRFPAADGNKDGKLTAEEARAYRQQLTGESGGERASQKAPAAKKAKRAAALEIAPDRADLSYGPHPSNRLDLWLAKSRRSTPLIVFIHGGGFVGGDKASVSSAAIKQSLEAGVSFAAINYRFRTEVPINTVLRDSARAIQYLRYKADELHLDKTRVAAFGGSAGAGTSLWLAFHDDLAEPASDDPVLRESTRLLAAASSAGQATYDILKWRDILGSDEAMRFYPESTWPLFYGLTTPDELKSPRGQQLRADVDMLGLISRGDPPVWLGASNRHDALENKGDTNHSPKHSQAIKRRCDELGVPAVLKIGDAVSPGGESSPIEFLLHQIGESFN